MSHARSLTAAIHRILARSAQKSCVERHGMCCALAHVTPRLLARCMQTHIENTPPRNPTASAFEHRQNLTAFGVRAKRQVWERGPTAAVGWARVGRSACPMRA
eukprot:640437-Rhodomonas_salina.1